MSRVAGGKLNIVFTGNESCVRGSYRRGSSFNDSGLHVLILIPC